MNYKGLTAGLVLAGAVATPIGLTLSTSTNAYEDKDYKILIASAASIKTLNMFKAGSLDEANEVTGLYNTSLIKSRPSGDDNGGLETALSIPKLAVNFGKTGDTTLPATTDDFKQMPLINKGTSSYEGFTPDLGTSLTYFNISEQKRVGYNIRDTRFWNGDRVTAEDFINTVKIALNVKNAVPWVWTIEKTMPIFNAKEIVDAQNKEGLSFEEALKKYPLGVQADPSSVIDPDDMATSAEGKEYFKDKPRHSKIIYTFAGGVAQRFNTSFACGSLGTPTSTRHFEKVGFDNWGTSVDNIMGAGPFKLKYFDLDYKIVSDRWDGYWDRNKTISPQIEMRVLPDTSSQIQLFKQKKIGKVTFGTSMLPQFLGSADLKKFVKPTNWSEVLHHITFNTKIENSNAKYLLDADFRNAIQYIIDRQKYLASLGADNSYSTETFSTLQNMSDPTGTGVVNNTIGFKNNAALLPEGAFPVGTAVDSWNKIYDLGGEHGSTDKTLFTRSEGVLSATDISKNDKTDHVHDVTLAKEYFAEFKKKHPDFKGVNLRMLVGAGLRENVTTFKQDIEDNLPGVTVTIVPKPDAVEAQVAGGMDWDMRFESWSQDYYDPWSYYHLNADKIIKDPSLTDAYAAAGLQQNAASDGFSLVDYIAQRLHEDPNYFLDHYFGVDSSTSDAQKDTYRNIIAQFLRMETVVSSENPTEFSSVPYDNTVWTRKATKDNDYKGYKDEFSKFKSVFPGSVSWGQDLKDYVATNSSKDEWQSAQYRYSILYPFIEKLFRESAINIGISRIQNSFIASRFIGEANYSGMIKYFGWVYEADNIPPSRYALPGIEAITK